jgi:hypothetical protein
MNTPGPPYGKEPSVKSTRLKQWSKPRRPAPAKYDFPIATGNYCHISGYDRPHPDQSLSTA